MLDGKVCKMVKSYDTLIIHQIVRVDYAENLCPSHPKNPPTATYDRISFIIICFCSQHPKGKKGKYTDCKLILHKEN